MRIHPMRAGAPALAGGNVSVRSLRNPIFLVTMVLALLPEVSWAGRVYGTAKDPKGQLVTHATIHLTNTRNNSAVTVETNDDGKYSVFLEPGWYSVVLDGADWTDVVRSSDGTSHQDIHFHERGK